MDKLSIFGLLLVSLFVATSGQGYYSYCVDRNRYCQDWRKRGECYRNPVWMKQNCCKSCKQAVNGGFSRWSNWGRCSKTCGGGLQKRTRLCNNPSPRNGGRNCQGGSSQTRKCNSQKCKTTLVKPTNCADTFRYKNDCKGWAPSLCVEGGRFYKFMKDHCKEACGFCKNAIHGGFGKWTPWSVCSKACGEGSQNRRRLCNNPAPMNGGTDCKGKKEETRTCKVKDCDGGNLDCEDKYGDTCVLWATAYCVAGNQYYKFMHKNCRKACKFCGEKDKCAKDNGGCQQNCKVKDNEVECSCDDGFMINPDFKTCTKVPVTKGGTCGKVKEYGELGRVVGGVDAFPFKWHWQGGIHYFEELVCGGTLIAPDLFLTAAHCVMTRGKEGMVIRMGDYKRTSKDTPEQDRKVKKIVIHKDWDLSSIQNDIALIKVESHFQLNKEVGVVCLPAKDSSPPDESTCYITGWGRTAGNSDLADVLQEAKLPIVPNDVCKERNKNSRGKSKLTSDMMCGGFQDKDSIVSGCRGDSGGPYVCKRGSIWELQGVVSWGSSRCDVQHRYTVFTRVANYIDWIEEAKKEANKP